MENLTFIELTDSVRDYSHAVIQHMRDANALAVLCGRLASRFPVVCCGMKVESAARGTNPQQWLPTRELLNASARGIRQDLPPNEQPQIIIHVADGGDNAACRWFFDHLNAFLSDYDATRRLLLSVWHGSTADPRNNLTISPVVTTSHSTCSKPPIRGRSKH